jgi:hypothetical protein
MAKKTARIAPIYSSNSTGGYNFVPNPFGEDLTFTKDTKQSDESVKRNRENMKKAYKRKHG